MRFVAKSPFFFFSVVLKKGTRKAYGICSKVEKRNKKTVEGHWLLFDCDADVDIDYFYAKYDEPVCYYKTVNGYHVVVFKMVSFQRAAFELLQCPYVDVAYVATGLKRGYWFLETPVPVFYAGVKYMKIERVKK